MTESTMQNSHQVHSAVALSHPPAVLPILGRASLPSRLPRTPSHPPSPSHPHSPTLYTRHLARPLHLTHPSTSYSRRLVLLSRPPRTPGAASRVFCVSLTLHSPCIPAASFCHLAHFVHPPPRASSCCRLVLPVFAVINLCSLFSTYGAGWAVFFLYWL